MLPKFIVYGISFIVLIFFAALPASAQTPDPATSLRMGLPQSVSPTSPLYTDLLVNNLFHTFSCLAIGQSVIGQPCLTYQMTQNAQGMLQGVPVLSQVNTSGGALGGVTSVIGMLYQNPPLKTTDYLASVGQGLGIVKTANAQVTGSGAQVLSPILRLWQVSRNISYVLMIIIFLVIGLMVMFRNKINPQTVITAQAALPGLVIGLILITFSYFLAGLISDMAFVGTNVVGYYFVAAQDKLSDQDWADQQNLVKQMSTENSLSIFGQLSGIVTQDKAQDALASIYNKFSQEVRERVDWLAGLLAYQFTSGPAQQIPVIGQFVGPVIGLIGLGIASNNPTAILGIVVAFVSTFVLIYAMLKLLLRLVTAYLTIIFLTITAPFQLLFASLPGRQGLATGWMLNMLGNILIFPSVIAIFYFIAFILGQSFGPLRVANLNHQQEGDIVHTAYVAGDNQIIRTTTFPLFGNMDLSFINILLAFGALVALPSIPDIVVKSIGKMGQAGQIMGQEISGSIRSGQGYAGRVPSGVSGAAGGIGTAIGGESQVHFIGGVPTVVKTKMGLIDKPWKMWGSKKGAAGGGIGS